MKQAYLIVGWMTEKGMGLTLSEWQEVLSRINPMLDYVPFEVSGGNKSIIGVIDTSIAKECDFKITQYLSPALVPLCENSANQSDLFEYQVDDFHFAYIGCSSLEAPVVEDLSHIQSFEEFAVAQGLRFSIERVDSPYHEEVYQIKLENKRGQVYTARQLFTPVILKTGTVEDSLEGMASRLQFYQTETEGEERTLLGHDGFSKCVRDCYVFTTQEERKTLIRLLNQTKKSC